MAEKEIIYCSDLIKELQEYIKEYGDDRIIVDFQTRKTLGNDNISRLLQVPDDDLGDTGYYCYLICTRADYEGRTF